MTSALRPVMQRVATRRGRRGGSTTASGRARSGCVPVRLGSAPGPLGVPRRAVVASVVVLAVLLTVVRRGPVRGSAATSARRCSARPRSPGRSGPLESAPRERWSATIDGTVAPVLAGRRRRRGRRRPRRPARRIVGLDVVAGPRAVVGAARRRTWSRRRVLCRPIDAQLVCVVGPDGALGQPQVRPRRAGRHEAGPVRRLLRIDPADGRVLSRSEMPGWVVATAQMGSDLVVATYAWGMLAVRRLDPATGAVRWQTERWSTFRSAGSSRVSAGRRGGPRDGDRQRGDAAAGRGSRGSGCHGPTGSARVRPGAAPRRRHARAHPVPGPRGRRRRRLRAVGRPAGPVVHRPWFAGRARRQRRHVRPRVHGERPDRGPARRPGAGLRAGVDRGRVAGA